MCESGCVFRERVCRLGKVEVPAAHAHLVVEVVQLAVGDATDAALLGVAEEPEALLSAHGEKKLKTYLSIFGVRKCPFEGVVVSQREGGQ